MFDTRHNTHDRGTLHTRLSDAQIALRPWGRSLINYREALRRAAMNIETRRVVRLRSC